MHNPSNFDWLEHVKTHGSKLELEPVKRLLMLLGDPQTSFQSIHVTGTNGKGSTTAMTASILEAAGHRTGMFTSPHLSRVTESVKIDDEEISLAKMDSLLTTIRENIRKLTARGIRHPTWFEVLVALAYSYFSQENVDIAVVEVGMGGRNDATNVIDSLASIVTNVSLEHTQLLGDTVEEIAEVKAGVLKNCSVLITAATQPGVIAKISEMTDQRNSRLIRVDNDVKIFPEAGSIEGQGFTVTTPACEYTGLTLPLIGAHQLRNAACAIAAVEAAKEKGFEVAPEDVRRGLGSVRWPGRFEVMEREPLVVLDGAKDAEAVKALVETVKQTLQGRRLISIVGISSDKAHRSMIHSLAEVTERFILTEHRVRGRTTRAAHLQKIAMETGIPAVICTPVHEAIEQAKQLAGPEDVILVTGSVFLVGEAREYWYPVSDMLHEARNSCKSGH